MNVTAKILVWDGRIKGLEGMEMQDEITLYIEVPILKSLLFDKTTLRDDTDFNFVA